MRNALEQVTGDTQTGGTNPTSLGWGYDSAYRLTSRSNSAAGTSSTHTADNADELTALRTTTGSTLSQNLSFTYNQASSGRYPAQELAPALGQLAGRAAPL